MFSSRKARPIVPASTTRKTTTGIDFGRGLTIVASSARRSSQEDHAIARRNTVRALLLLDVPGERARRALRESRSPPRGLRGCGHVDQRQRDPVLGDDRLGDDLSVDRARAEHQPADGVARRELRVQEGEILEAVRVRDRDPEPLRLLGGRQRRASCANRRPHGKPCCVTPSRLVLDHSSDWRYPTPSRPTRTMRGGESECQDEPVDTSLPVARDDVGVESEVH